MFYNNTTDTKERLKSISHHFLGSDGHDTVSKSNVNNTNVNKNNANKSNVDKGRENREVHSSRRVNFLPVLLESGEQDAFVFGLNSYLNDASNMTVVVNVDSALKASLPVENKSDLELTKRVTDNRKRIYKHVSEMEVEPELCLLPFVSSDIRVLQDNDFLLAVVPASLKGVRNVFHKIEKATADLNDVSIGIVTLNANSLRMSQLCYDVIENSIESFLGFKSVMLGHLLADNAIDLTKGRIINFPDDVDQLNSAPIELDDISFHIHTHLSTYITHNGSVNNLNPNSQQDPEDGNIRTLTA